MPAGAQSRPSTRTLDRTQPDAASGATRSAGTGLPQAGRGYLESAQAVDDRFAAGNARYAARRGGRGSQSETACGRLLEAGIALSSELSLDALLQRLVETAAELTGARYAALGVIDRAARARAVPDHRHRRGDAGRDRRPAARPRHPRRADPRGAAAAPARSRRRPALGRLPARPPADAHVPRRADPAARRRLRQPLPDREGRRRGLHRRRRGARRAARGQAASRSRTRASTRPRRAGRGSSSR